MTIRRAPRKANFTVLPNEALTDDRLSFKARGLLAYILSKPDHWKTSSHQLAKVGPDGLTSVRTGMKELQDLGYASLLKQRNSDGTFVSEWLIGDSTGSETDAGFSDLGSSNVGKPVSLVKTELASTELAKTDLSALGRQRFSTCDGTEHPCGPFCGVGA